MKKYFEGEIEIITIGEPFILNNPSVEIIDIEYEDNNCHALCKFETDDPPISLKKILIANPVGGEEYSEEQINTFISEHEILGQFE